MSSATLRHPLALAAASLLVLGACGDDNGNDPSRTVTLPVTTTRLREAAAEINEVSWQAFTMPSIPGCVTGLEAGATADVLAPGLPATRLRADTLARTAAVTTVAPANRGLTWVRDAGCSWRVDTLDDGTPRPGAPAAGVRFILQEIVNNVPTATRLGHIDVVDRDPAGEDRHYDITVVPASATAPAISIEALDRWGDQDMTYVVASESVREGRRVTLIDSSRFWRDTIALTIVDAPSARTTVRHMVHLQHEPTAYVTTAQIRVDGREIVLEGKLVPGPPRRDSLVILVNGGRVAVRTATGPDLLEGWMRGDGQSPVSATELEAIDAVLQLARAGTDARMIEITVGLWAARDIQSGW